VTGDKGPTPSEIWDAMKRSEFAFALIDPATVLHVDANERCAALYGVREVKGTNLLDMCEVEVAQSVKQVHDAFQRGTIQSVRGQGSLKRASGEAIELKGWARRFEWEPNRVLVVTAAAELHSGTLPDDRYWVAQAPQVFGLSMEGSDPLPNEAAKRADQLEQHMWRIAQEMLAAGIIVRAARTRSLGTVEGFTELTIRQRDILVRVLAGERVKEIARDMYLSPSTVRNHLTAIYRRFGVHSQVELISSLANRAHFGR
jgi:DNA-binding CsgD family transcriptional regulator